MLSFTLESAFKVEEEVSVGKMPLQVESVEIVRFQLSVENGIIRVNGFAIWLRFS